MPTITDFELLKEIYRHQNSHANGIAAIDRKLELFMQESRYHRRDIRGRLEKLEEKAKARRIDLSGILKSGIEKFWIQILLFVLLASGNTKLVDLVQQAVSLKK